MDFCNDIGEGLVESFFMKSTYLRWREGKRINVRVIVASFFRKVHDFEKDKRKVERWCFIRQGREGSRVFKSWCDIFSPIFIHGTLKEVNLSQLALNLLANNVSFTLFKLPSHLYLYGRRESVDIFEIFNSGQTKLN